MLVLTLCLLAVLQTNLSQHNEPLGVSVMCAKAVSTQSTCQQLKAQGQPQRVNTNLAAIVAVKTEDLRIVCAAGAWHVLVNVHEIQQQLNFWCPRLLWQMAA